MHEPARGGRRLLARASGVQIALADVIRAVDGPLANVRGVRSEQLEYEGSAESLLEVWVAVRASLRNVLEHVTLADVATAASSGVASRSSPASPDAWEPH